jgi:hypothetical protein
MILATHGIIASSGGVIVPPLLDDYPNAAAAYSLRKLRSAYTGSAIRVRRTNLDEINIGFTSTGELDTAALLAFTGTGALNNGFVTTWYDQSGNGRNATQTTALNQPQIVSGGSVITENGKPSLQFDGVNDELNANGLASLFTGTDLDITTIGVIKSNNTSAANKAFLGFGQSTTVNQLYWVGEGSTTLNEGSMDLRDDSLVLKTLRGGNVSNQSLHYVNGNYDDINLYINNVFEQNSTIGLGSITFDRFSLGCITRTTSVIHWNGKIQESIVYDSNESATRNGISTNINDFYSIY